ncbi:hypothetical protein BD410DRAFT_809547 [Rickenella mellea]|uniref:Uncharacterized protein n=1 Tax=Rickenella mellea TaxID=50990 RepID=A0A4Y7PHB3_9AGAM|nr:hypothetical protein BD410DRAFT_809547 [Rickenella mellea]
MSDQISELFATAQDIQISRILSLSAAVVLGYDALLTFPEYVLHLPLIYMYSEISAVSVRRDGIWRFHSQRHGRWIVLYSTKYTFIETWGSRSLWLCTFPLQITLSLRTLAIWDRDWRATVVLGVGAATYNISVLVGSVLLTKWFRYVPNPLLELLLGCYGGFTGLTTTITKSGFASLMFYDGVMFILILIKTVREGMIYYAVLFALSLANLLMATSLPQFELTLVGSLAPALLVAQSIGASHIILNLRKYAHADETLTSGQLSGIRYSERRSIFDEFTFTRPTVLDDSELAVMESDRY